MFSTANTVHYDEEKGYTPYKICRRKKLAGEVIFIARRRCKVLSKRSRWSCDAATQQQQKQSHYPSSSQAGVPCKRLNGSTWYSAQRLYPRLCAVSIGVNPVGFLGSGPPQKFGCVVFCGSDPHENFTERNLVAYQQSRHQERQFVSL